MKLIRNIGRGGFGVVDEMQNTDGAHIARKTFSINQPYPVDKDFIDHVKKRFSREVSIQSSLSSQNIVSVIGSDLDADPPYFFMPLADSSLDKDMKSDRILGGRFLEAISDIISGLEEMHQLRYFHRDLKPQNVLRFTKYNGSEGYSSFYAISDFGLASLKDTQISCLTNTGMRMGSDYYTAPEIVADLRNASARSDIFSLGCILHDFVGIGSRVPCNEIREEGPYGAILLNCTRREIGRRFESVSSVRDALLAVGHHLPTSLTSGANDVINLLDSEQILTALQWKMIVEFLDDRSDSEDAKAILRKITLLRIQEICHYHCDLASRLGYIFSNWVRLSSFPFSECDGLANRLEYFIAAGDLEVQSEALLAMLIMGTSHNRWYVEGKFMHVAGPQMNPILAQRLAIEFRANSQQVCRAIMHLKQSLNIGSVILHPILSHTLSDICR